MKKIHGYMRSLFPNPLLGNFLIRPLKYKQQEQELKYRLQYFE